MRWRPYTAATVVGDLRVLRGELDRDLLDRDLFVWLPPGHDTSDERYPAIYLHDAQNLFDEALSNSGEWRFDEALAELAAEGLPLIGVGLPHAGVLRSTEYVGRGLDAHVARLLAAKRIVDADFRTAPATGVGGSSFGAYAALYAWTVAPQTFSRVLAMSPAFFGDRPRIFRAVEEAERSSQARIWLDVGDSENSDPGVREEYLDGHAAMTRLLRDRGFGDDRLHSSVHAGAVHHESAWAARLPDALRFLFG